MTIFECLRNEIFLLPQSVGKQGMVRFLENTFSEYQKLIAAISEEIMSAKIRQHKDEIANLCKQLILSFSNYDKGYTKVAYSNFEEAMNILKPFLFPENTGIVVDPLEPRKPFYRARIGSNKPFCKSGMFHLPFTIREKANTQRFSIPGLPCLYLSNSIYVCWEELNRPALSTFQVSRFQQENNDLKILNLTYTPAKFLYSYKVYSEAKEANYSNKNIENITPFYYNMGFWVLITWPLSLVCSLIVENEIAPFKKEYVFPQFLLEWVVTEKGIDGIKYFSVKSNPYNKDDYSNFTNYVFPPKNFESGRYCNHLMKSFKLSESFSAEIFSIADPNYIFLTKEWMENAKNQVRIEPILVELIKGLPMPYTHTLFGKMEILMRNSEVDFLDEVAM